MSRFIIYVYKTPIQITFEKELEMNLSKVKNTTIKLLNKTVFEHKTEAMQLFKKISLEDKTVNIYKYINDYTLFIFLKGVDVDVDYKTSYKKKVKLASDYIGDDALKKFVLSLVMIIIGNVYSRLIKLIMNTTSFGKIVRKSLLLNVFTVRIKIDNYSKLSLKEIKTKLVNCKNPKDELLTYAIGPVLGSYFEEANKNLAKDIDGLTKTYFVVFNALEFSGYVGTSNNPDIVNIRIRSIGRHMIYTMLQEVGLTVTPFILHLLNNAEKPAQLYYNNCKTTKN